jgi:acetolactate synthase-1/2/3 large subunit
MSADPLASRYPFREFETDLLVTGETPAALTALDAAMASAMKDKSAAISARRTAIGQLRNDQASARSLALEKARNAPRSSGIWVTHCLNELKARDAIVINELGFNAPDYLELTEWGSYMATSLAGGLGFGLGAALGAKLAAPIAK